jgi:hypothetical protein
VILSPVVILAILLWAGLCAADQRALGGRQLHQPIVAAAGAGLILHAPERALLVGMWLQFVWVAPMPIGGAILPDTGSAAIAAVLVAAAVPGPLGIGAAIVVGLLIGAMSIPWERALREANGRREEGALEADRAGAAGTGESPPCQTAGGAAASRSGASNLNLAIALGVAGPFARGVMCAGAAMAVGLALASAAGATPMGRDFANGSAAFERALLGGAACFGLAGLLLCIRPQKSRVGAAWVLAGVLIGLAGGLLLRGGRG